MQRACGQVALSPTARVSARGRPGSGRLHPAGRRGATYAREPHSHACGCESEMEKLASEYLVPRFPSVSPSKRLQRLPAGTAVCSLELKIRGLRGGTRPSRLPFSRSANATVRPGFPTPREVRHNRKTPAAGRHRASALQVLTLCACGCASLHPHCPLQALAAGPRPLRSRSHLSGSSQRERGSGVCCRAGRLSGEVCCQ